MIAAARAHVREQGLENVTFRCDDISRLDGFGDASVDGVVSTMALHHLPSLDHLAACFRAIARVLKPGGALYLVDFGLLKSERSIAHFVAENRPHQSAEFSLEFEQSMKAAFMPDELGLLARAHLPRGTAFHRTFQIPLLNVAKSPDRPIAPELLARFRELRAALPAPYKRQLDDMRLFFWLGGLRNDPFRRRLRAFSPVAQAETSPSA
jgi:SAM-dependent methyltransferase